MKKLIALLAALAILVTLGSTVAFADGANAGVENKPLFNYFQPGETCTFDKETGVYAVNDATGISSRLSAVDGENKIIKPEFSDDLIRFSYRFTKTYMTPVMAPDWCLYFTFRNLDGESPLWSTSYSSYLVINPDSMFLLVVYAGEWIVQETVKFDSSIFNATNELVDTEFHSIEIAINDETGVITATRDKGAAGEKSVTLQSFVTEKNKICMLDVGGYSFSSYRNDFEIEDLYFFDSKATEAIDDVAVYEAIISGGEVDPGDSVTPPDDGEGNVGDNEGNEDDDKKEEKKGCKGAVSASGLAALMLIGGAVLFKKKEN